MSRSQKHVPVVKDSHRSGGKRLLLRRANRRVRRDWDLASGRAYRKAFCSYRICDYRFHETLADSVERVPVRAGELSGVQRMLQRNWKDLKAFFANVRRQPLYHIACFR